MMRPADFVGDETIPDRLEIGRQPHSAELLAPSLVVATLGIACVSTAKRSIRHPCAAPYDRHQRVWSHGVDDELGDRSTELQACETEDVGCTQIPPDHCCPHRRNLLRDSASARFRFDEATTGVSDSFGAGDCRTTEPTRAPPPVAGCRPALISKSGASLSAKRVAQGARVFVRRNERCQPTTRPNAVNARHIATAALEIISARSLTARRR